MKSIDNNPSEKVNNQSPAFNFEDSNSIISESALYRTSATAYSKNKLINLLERNVFVKLFSLSKRVHLNKNEFLYRPEEQIDYLYFPESAVISNFQMLADGRTIETLLIGNDGVTKPLELFNKKFTTDWTQVVLAGTALKIKTHDLSQVFNDNSSLQIIIFNYINECFEQYSSKIICNTHHLLQGRLCRWLLMLHDLINKDTLRITHEQIARPLGVYRPNVSAVTKFLEREKIIESKRGIVTILNRQRLEDIACSCYLLSNLNFNKKAFAEIPINL